MTLVKICGVSEIAHARAAAALGADFVGMVFAPSRRQVTLGQAKRIASGLRNDGEPAYERLPVKAAWQVSKLWALTTREVAKIDQPLLVLTSRDDHVVEPAV